MVNTYSHTWFKLFLETQAFTDQEVTFVMRNIPGSKIGRVLDVCCGSGRHSNYLAAHGYKVVGIDLDKAALEKARREATGTVMYLQKDMRRLEDLPGTFDAVICMWQSFGYFDAIVNRDVLRQMSEVLRENGRLILDIYNRHFFEQNQGSYQIERKGISITATNTMHGNRLTAHLAYANEDKPDIFNWQLFTPIEIKQMAAELGLQCIVACTECDEQKPPTANRPRMMLVFEKQLGD